MARLTEAEKDLICDMCMLAEANADLMEMNETDHGEGDYEGWTRADFKRAEAIFKKMFDPIAFAEKLAGRGKDAA